MDFEFATEKLGYIFKFYLNVNINFIFFQSQVHYARSSWAQQVD